MQVTADQLERVRFQALARFKGNEDDAQNVVIEYWRLMQTDSALLAHKPDAFCYFTAVSHVASGRQVLRTDRPRGEKRDATGRVLETCTITADGRVVRVPRYVDALDCRSPRPAPTSLQALCDDLDGRPSRAAIDTMRELDALASA